MGKDPQTKVILNSKACIWQHWWYSNLHKQCWVASPLSFGSRTFSMVWLGCIKQGSYCLRAFLFSVFILLIFIFFFSSTSRSYSGNYSSVGASQSQKKRLLAKAQSECLNNNIITKQEPHSIPPAELQYQQVCHGAPNCKESYHFVTPAQDQHIVYTGSVVGQIIFFYRAIFLR